MSAPSTSRVMVAVAALPLLFLISAPRCGTAFVLRASTTSLHERRSATAASASAARRPTGARLLPPGASRTAERLGYGARLMMAAEPAEEGVAEEAAAVADDEPPASAEGEEEEAAAEGEGEAEVVEDGETEVVAEDEAKEGEEEEEEEEKEVDPMEEVKQQIKVSVHDSVRNNLSSPLCRCAHDTAALRVSRRGTVVQTTELDSEYSDRKSPRLRQVDHSLVRAHLVRANCGV